MLYHILFNNNMFYSIVLYCTVVFYDIVYHELHHTVLHYISAIWYINIILYYYNILCYSILDRLCDITSCYMVMYHMSLYCNILLH